MASLFVETGEAVLTELIASGLLVGAVQATPFRTYLPNFELKDLNQLKVPVVIRKANGENGSREKRDYEYSYDIGILKRFDQITNAGMDPLVDVALAITAHFYNRKLSVFPRAQFVRVDNEPVFWEDHLRELSQFTSVIQLFYKAMEA